MGRYITANTHHAYLNTDIVLSSELPSVDIKDELTGEVYKLSGKPLAIKLGAGKHKLYCENLDEAITIEIEDAIKLGGSKVKEAFVFDENPWIFVVTKDRLYACNTETNEEKIEYNLTPAEIHAHSKLYGKTCDYFLLRTEKDYSIYDVTTGTHVISFTGYIYSNTHLVIYREEENIVVYNYRNKKVIEEFSGIYSFGSKFYYVKGEKLFGLDLSSDGIKKIESVGNINNNCLLINNYLLKLYSDSKFGGKRYHLYSLDNAGDNITKSEITLPYYIESFLGNKTQEYSALVESYKDFSNEQKETLNKMSSFDVCCMGLRISHLETPWEEKKMLAISGEIVSYPSKPYNIPFLLKGDFEGTLNFRDVLIESGTIADPEASKECRKDIKVESGETLLGKSLSGSRYVTMLDGNIILHESTTPEKKHLFRNMFDTSSYNSAYFTSDGKNVVFVNKDKSMGILGFEDMIQQPFEVEGSTVARYAGFNGYKPEILIQETNGRKPVWRDPISLKRIREAEMSNHVFMSPDGRFAANMQKLTVYYNRLTEEEMSFEEFLQLQKKYNWLKDVSEEEKKIKTSRREQLLQKYGKERLFHHAYEYYEHSIYSTRTNVLSDEQIEKRIESLKNTAEEEYLQKENDFTPLFVDILGYVCYKEANKDAEHRILIGRSVWFLNYVSFSYDSRYLAFGAKMNEDTWRRSEEGVFEIYDLKEEKVVDRKDTDFDLHAIWMTMFNKNGDVAYYDSHANAMVAYAKSEYRDTHMAKGKSLLCFSPSGKYIALSDQNYISFIYHSQSDWGHQPSGNIFIYKTEDLDTCLEHYNDFGEGIDGTTRMTRRAGSVASAAFSSDEKRLLAVGEDGVIVIRNLISPAKEAFDKSDDDVKATEVEVLPF